MFGKWWMGLVIATVVVTCNVLAVIKNGVTGWTVFAGFVVGALVVQSFYIWLITGYRRMIDNYRTVFCPGWEITIEEIKEDKSEVQVDNSSGRSGDSGT